MFDVFVGFGQPGVNNLSLLRRVLVVGVWKLGTVNNNFGCDDNLSVLKRKLNKVALGQTGLIA